MKPLTFGMACYDDYHGVYMTTMGLLCNHPREYFDLLVVDNNPTSKHGQETKKHCAKIGALYVPYTQATGTAAPRNLVFEAARTEYVVCSDSHIMLKGPDFELGYPGGVAALMDYFRSNPNTRDLITGPQVHDSMSVYNTHFNDEWGGHMHGRWGQGWQCSCRKRDALRFTVVKEPDETAGFYRLGVGRVLVTQCPACGKTLPAMPFAGSHQKLVAEYYRPLGREVLDPAFEIPAQGLGLFACRKDAWLGFNPNFRGFGGEEMYIHEKYRRAGAKVVCLPGLPWWHRYGKTEDVARYPNSLYERARNYVLGRLELGLPLDDVKANFVYPNSKVTPALWDYLMQDPVMHTKAADCKECAVGANPIPTYTLPQPDGVTVEAITANLITMPRDLDQHLATLQKLASQCTHVTEFSKRRESTPALMAAPMVLSYNIERDPLQDRLRMLAGNGLVLEHKPSTDVPAIPQTDMLFIDSIHTHKAALDELRKYGKSVAKFIVFHDTHTYGMRGEDGSSGGLLSAMSDYIRENPEWFFSFHSPTQHGLTCITRLLEAGVFPKAFVTYGKGPGTELKKLLASLGITEKPSCDCNAKAKVMDNWGVRGCEMRFPTIVQWLNEGKQRWGWTAAFGAGFQAVLSGLAFQINPIDPIPSLVRLAIENAKKEEADESLLHNANVQPLP